MASTKPTILLVPGSFCPSALFFDPVANQLRKAGYSVIPIELLTVGPPSTAKPATMEDDAARIHGIVEWLLDNGKDVLIAMNSYGGIPTTQACQGLSKKERDAGGKIGGQIIGLVYMSALLVQNNENLAESLGTGAGLPDYVKINVRCGLSNRPWIFFFLPLLRDFRLKANLDIGRLHDPRAGRQRQSDIQRPTCGRWPGVGGENARSRHGILHGQADQHESPPHPDHFCFVHQRSGPPAVTPTKDDRGRGEGQREQGHRDRA